MASGIKGDMEALRQMKRRVANIKSPEFRQRVLSVIGQEALYRVLQCFEKSKDPYGNPWKPLTVRNGQPLLDTGRLRNSLNLREVGSTHFEISTDVKYARLHQFGGTVTPKNARMLSFMVGNRRVFAKKVTIPARPFTPDDRGVPRIWAGAFRREAYEFIQTRVGKRAGRTRLGAG